MQVLIISMNKAYLTKQCPDGIYLHYIFLLGDYCNKILDTLT